MIDEAIRKRNEPTNQPNKFFLFFFFGVIRGRTPLYREKGRWVRPLLGVGMGGVYRRTFFFVSFRFVNLWRKEQGKGRGEKNEKGEGEGGGRFWQKQV